MNDSEKLELLSILEEIKAGRKTLDEIEKRVRRVLAGLAPGQTITLPKVAEAPASINPPIGTSIHDSVGTVRTPNAAEIKSHTLDFNDHLTKGH